MHKPFEEKKIVMYLRNSFVENVVLQGSAEISYSRMLLLCLSELLGSTSGDIEQLYPGRVAKCTAE